MKSSRLVFGLASCLVVALPAAGSAQLRAVVVGDPKVGQDAPDFTAPYVTAAGPGPASQPFRLRAELGRTVVLVFGTSSDTAEMTREWQALAETKDSLFRPGTVVIGLLRWKAEPTQALASSLGVPFKFLPDTLGRGFSRFGVVGTAVTSGRWTVFVVDPEGRVKYRSTTFRPTDPRELDGLFAAIGERS